MATCDGNILSFVAIRSCSLDARMARMHDAGMARFEWLPWPREKMVEISHAGFPTHEDLTWRTRFQEMHSSERRDAILRAKHFGQWGNELVGRDIRAGLRAVRYLRHFLIVHEGRIVHRARSAGLSWDEIGYYLGLERQTVHRRWAKRIGSTDLAGPLPRIQAPSGGKRASRR